MSKVTYGRGYVYSIKYHGVAICGILATL